MKGYVKAVTILVSNAGGLAATTNQVRIFFVSPSHSPGDRNALTFDFKHVVHAMSRLSSLKLCVCPPVLVVRHRLLLEIDQNLKSLLMSI